MKKYFILEELGNEKNALSKAREDANKILKEQGWEAIKIHRKNPNQMKVMHYFRMLLWTNIDWIKVLIKTEKNAVLFIQFPFLNSLFFNKIAAQYIKKLKNKKNVKIILLIHDIDSLRFPNEKQKQYIHEKIYWDLSDVIISHNKKMKEYLSALELKVKILELQMFDYLLQSNTPIEYTRKGEIVIAGNLDVSKAGYLKELKKLKNNQFILYGVGFDDSIKAQNIEYAGAFSSKELLENIHGSWGLVWDGNSIYDCTGEYGNYLRYNNPHKLSFYAAIGMPVIVWRQSAISEFVETKKIGISLNSLKEMDDIINQISELEYNRMVENLEKLSVELRGGEFLKRALKESTDLFMN